MFWCVSCHYLKEKKEHIETYISFLMLWHVLLLKNKRKNQSETMKCRHFKRILCPCLQAHLLDTYKALWNFIQLINQKLCILFSRKKNLCICLINFSKFLKITWWIHAVICPLKRHIKESCNIREILSNRD